MSEAAAIARRWFEEVWGQRREATITELVTPDCRAHLAHGTVVGPEPFLSFWREILSLFPDCHVEIQDVVGSGESAAVRWRLHGTATGTGFGIASTQNRIDAIGTTWFRVQGGRIVEGWDCWDSAAAFARVRGV